MLKTSKRHQGLFSRLFCGINLRATSPSTMFDAAD
jgi:hypothetical protein